MKIVFASDSFKGSLSSERINLLLEEAAKKVFPGCKTVGIPIADGGEGTVDAMVMAVGGVKKSVTVKNPLMKDIVAEYGVISEDTAVVELAAASGLTLLSDIERNPLNTTSYGTGQLIKNALDNGFRKIIIAIGGSATNDGGMGALSALGVKFFDAKGDVLEGIGNNLEKVAGFDTNGLHPAITETEFTVMCDVDNPLTGEHGATNTFGAQKGGTAESLECLENGMRNYAALLGNHFNIDVNSIKGGGAAGGIGAALRLFLNASMRSGINILLDTVNFDAIIKDACLVVTGEGRMDMQSAHGKAISGVGARCKEQGVPVLALVGSTGDGAEQLYDMGIESIMPIVDSCMSLDSAILNAEKLYSNAAERAFRMIKIGSRLSFYQINH